MAGLHGRKRNSYPRPATEEQIREFLAGWKEGAREANLRRQEAKRIADVGYRPGTVAVKGRNGRIKYLTHEQYNRNVKRNGTGS
jgi:hypothetical protein